MRERVCDSCGEQKKLEGGKTCDKGHFICYQCRGVSVFSNGKTRCPICKGKLR